MKDRCIYNADGDWLIGMQFFARKEKQLLTVGTGRLLILNIEKLKRFQIS